MKPLLVLALFAAQLVAAHAAPADDVAAAGKKLAGQPNYTWKSTVQVPESAQFKPGPSEGKTEADGFTVVTMTTFGDNQLEIVKKGDKAALTDMDGNFKLASELEKEEGPGRFMATIAKGLRRPTDDIAILVAGTKELKQDGDAYAGDLNEETLKKQFRLGEPKNPKGSVKFWLKDGAITKFQVKVEAKMEFNGNEFDASRTTTTEISAVGTTKVTVPESAKKLLM